MSKVAFKVLSPEKLNSCVVFASPHSGRDYPPSFMQRTLLDAVTIRSSEDAFVDLLFEKAPEFGAPLIKAGAPRAFVDLNRSLEELDPAVIEGVRRQGHNPRITSGLGVIPRVVANGREIYRGKISMNEADRRIALYWRPYHQMLQRLLDMARQVHGQAILIDCHSMPHEAMDGVVRSGRARPDVVLGDRFGAAADSTIVDEIESAFTSAGFTVVRNAPFAGAYVVQAYGRPSRKQHAIQVEIDRSLYMDERLIRPSAGFEDAKSRLQEVIETVAGIGQARVPLAAE